MYTKVRYFTFYVFVQLNTPRFDLLQFLYTELILKIGFGQAYGKDIVQRILRKFILYFYVIYSISY
jgi:hypothetical protein